MRGAETEFAILTTAKRELLEERQEADKRLAELRAQLSKEERNVDELRIRIRQVDDLLARTTQIRTQRGERALSLTKRLRSFWADRSEAFSVEDARKAVGQPKEKMQPLYNALQQAVKEKRIESVARGIYIVANKGKL